MLRRTLIFFIFIVAFSVFGQNYNKYQVKNGETITQIAEKNNITLNDIYQLNPDVRNGLKPNMVLLIPKKVSFSKSNTTSKTPVLDSEKTLIGIEKKHNISDDVLKKTTSALEKTIYHTVLPKETKYSIAKQYGITVEELEKRNPEIISNLPVGFQLLIKGNATKADKGIATQNEKGVLKSNVSKFVDYEVKSKETLYSLSKTFGLSQEELIAFNPELKSAVNEGMILKVPATASIFQEAKKVYTSLSKKSGLTGRKKLVLLLPFNMPKIESDTVNSTAMRLKKDKFLNMTLDFYSGALMAIDSAQSIGLPVDVSIFDSQETKNSSNVLNVIQFNNLQNSDAIIGPFYQINIEKVAELMSKNEIPVISPLSKDVGNAYPNLYKTIPTNELLRSAMFDYMKTKGGNIIAVVDKKKESVRQYIQENQKGVQFATLLENGSLSVESLKSLFVKEKINYVVMETANTGMIKWTINTMINAMPKYKVQLVILGTNETLDTDEINFENLVKLKLMYPSITRDSNSPEALVFEKEYRKENKIFPSTYAIRGFDVTFDTMMRLSQGKSFQETADTIATEQVDNKFEYYKTPEGGYTNKGVYIQYYDSDLFIKEAN